MISLVFQSVNHCVLVKVVRLLLMRGEVVHMLNQKQVDTRFKLPLHLAAKGGHVEVAR